MKYQMFAIFDKAVDAYAPPFYVRSKGEALRGFADQVNRPGENNGLFNHPEHFFIFHIGEYDDEECSVSMLEPRECLGCALEFKEEPDAAGPVMEMMNGPPIAS